MSRRTPSPLDRLWSEALDRVAEGRPVATLDARWPMSPEERERLRQARCVHRDAYGMCQADDEPGKPADPQPRCHGFDACGRDGKYHGTSERPPAQPAPWRCLHHFQEDSSRARGGRCRRHRCDVEGNALCPGWDHCPRQGRREEKGAAR